MRVFSCGNCGQTVYFDNVVCENCGTALGFDPSDLTMLTLCPADRQFGHAHHRAAHPRTYCVQLRSVRFATGWCRPSGKGDLCLSCGLNRTIPDLTVAGNLETLVRIREGQAPADLPAPEARPAGETRRPAERHGAAGRSTSSPTRRTGHDNGVITLNVAEADPAIRERTREQMNEPYRTLLGHFRHEIGHYYWFALVDNDRWLPRFRELFGDDSWITATALAAYHQNGPKPDWAQNYISAYATAHPWEDWAESWAHYMHMVDALDTADDYHDCAANAQRQGAPLVVLARLRPATPISASAPETSSTAGSLCAWR